LAFSRPGRLLFAHPGPAADAAVLSLFPDLETGSCPLAALSRSVADQRPDVVLVDLSGLGDPESVEVALRQVADLSDCEDAAAIVALLGAEDRRLAARAIGAGAADFFMLPLEPAVLSLVVRRALRVRELERENRRLRGTDEAIELHGMLGASEPIQALRRTLEKVAPTDATVLVLGESGTGKELAARALHALSPRRDRPFVALNCAAIPENLLESELFGVERGAFTGAVRRLVGKLETAQGGTVFFDEIGEMPVSLQAKLLRVLQQRTIERVGGREQIQLDVRIVCATNRQLDAEITKGAFREDLYYRVSEVTLRMPPLRERGADAPMIAKAVLARSARQHRRGSLQFSAAALEAIRAHAWPGNIRELENRITGAVIVAEGKRISPADLGLEVASAPERLTLREARRRAERAVVVEALERSGGNLSRAAELLAITRPTLYDLLDRLEVGGSVRDARAAEP
jgi:two-component system NtrC family response regulator